MEEKIKKNKKAEEKQKLLCWQYSFWLNVYIKCPNRADILRERGIGIVGISDRDVDD